MISLKGDITTALIDDATIKTLLCGERVYPLGTAPATQYPRITFFEVVNADADSADDAVYSSRLIYQIDVWAKGNPDPIAREVDRVMKSIGFSRNGGADLYENDTKVYHKSLRYAILAEETTKEPEEPGEPGEVE